MKVLIYCLLIWSLLRSPRHKLRNWTFSTNYPSSHSTKGLWSQLTMNGPLSGEVTVENSSWEQLSSVASPDTCVSHFRTVWTGLNGLIVVFFLRLLTAKHQRLPFLVETEISWHAEKANLLVTQIRTLCNATENVGVLTSFLTIIITYHPCILMQMKYYIFVLFQIENVQEIKLQNILP